MKPVQPPFFDVRGRGFRSRAEVEDVLQLLQARTSLIQTETAALLQLSGRVLARAVSSPVDVPGFHRAAMDGFAVRSADTQSAAIDNPRILNLVGESRPARACDCTISDGQAVRIATGAPVPAGADAILVVEAAQLDADGRVVVRQPVAAGRHISRSGEDVKQGQEVLPAGRCLRPQDVGLLSSIGVNSVELIKKPCVSILVTGNELLPPGSVPQGFAIVDSNSPMLTALVERDGGICFTVRRLPDDEATIRDAIREACVESDAILLAGGSSVGAEDHAPRLVAELGELAVHGIAMRPGGPTGVAFLPRPNPNSPAIPLFLLPGNPVSCLCAYDLFAGRVIRKQGGKAWELPYPRVSLPLSAPISSVAGRVDYVRVKVEDGGVLPLTASGASNLSSTTRADGFVLVERDRDQFGAGDLVEVWLY